MIKNIFTASALLLSFSLYGQVTETIKVKAGEDMSAALSTHGLYKFPGFTDGTVLFKDGSSTKAKMNFNVFINEIVFINNSNDTLAIGNRELVDSIKLDSNVFYYNRGYFLVVKDYGDTKLVRREKLNFENVKVGAFGLPNRGVSIDNYTTVTQQSTVYQLIVNEDVIIKKETLYLLTYKKFRSAKANLPGFVTAFPALKNEVQTFAESNDINFKKEADLKKMVQFCVEHSSN